jgi:hypothetical protein
VKPMSFLVCAALDTKVRMNFSCFVPWELNQISIGPH